MPAARRLRAALYHRVSTREQNPALARRELRSAAAARGMRVALDVEEVASAGRGSIRPGMERVMDAARRGRIDVVLVHRLDRWGRSTLDLLANIRQLRTAGVIFIAITQGLEVRPESDAVSDLTLTILAAAAEFERSVIVERTRDGIAAARRAGKRIGRPPAEDAPAPERVAALRAKGKSWTAIARKLGCARSAARRAFARGMSKQDTPRRGGRPVERSRR